MDNIIYHCPTKELAKDLLEHLHKKGLKWAAGNSLLDRNCWDYYKEQTCYRINNNFVSFSPKDFYEIDYPHASIITHTITMNKNIEMSVEQARELYKQHPEFRNTLLSVFTDNELGIYKPITPDLLNTMPFGARQIWMSGEITEVMGHKEYREFNIYPSESYAKSAIAFNKLCKLCYYYNQNTEVNKAGYSVDCDSNGRLYVCTYIQLSRPLLFNSLEDAKKCLKDNEQLWKEYYML